MIYLLKTGKIKNGKFKLKKYKEKGSIMYKKDNKLFINKLKRMGHNCKRCTKNENLKNGHKIISKKIRFEIICMSNRSRAPHLASLFLCGYNFSSL